MLLKNGARKLGAGNSSRWWISAAAFLLSLVCGDGQDIKLAIAPPPRWVTPVVLETPTIAANLVPAQDSRLLLKDRQINAQNNETYYHQMLQVISSRAAMATQSVLIDADIGCQTLTFHWARIWRGTNSFNQLAAERVVAAPPVAGQRDFLFGGKNSAHLLLPDVRPGDIIDYAYTVSGANPALGGRFVDRIHLQTSQPAERLVTRLLWPSSRRFYIQNHGTDIKPLTSALGSMAQFNWDLRKVPGLAIEPPLPTWYAPLPWAELSEFQRWSDVNQWALGLFTNAPLSSELARQINTWKVLPTAQDKVVAALNFVEDEIRSTEGEAGSLYKLTDPSTVFETRAGGEKEKNFLFVIMMRSLGIEAYPVLVNTRFRQTLLQMHPSPAVLDRLIAQVILDGQLYWLDADNIYAHGPLTVRTWPDYGYGLVVRAGTSALTAIQPSAVPSRTTVTHYVQLGGFTDPADWKVVTLGEGADAERMRAQYEPSEREDIAHRHLAAYKKVYPDIEQSRPMVYADDDQQNKVEVTEYYHVPKMWMPTKDQPYFHCEIDAINLQLAMAKPAIEERTMPLGVPFPNHQIFHAEVTVQSLALIKPEDETIENPAFVFHRSVAVSGSNVILDYDYRALEQAVLPEGMPNYLRQLTSSLDTLTYTINSD
jgi:transglutaminase-like putative cysteine protease